MDLFKLFGEIAIKNDGANSAIDNTTQKAEQSQSKISGAFKAIGTAVVAGFAVDKIKDFAMSAVQASADVSSEASMFTATFGDMGDSANSMFAGVAESTGILASRLQGQGASAFSMFKGAGMDANQSLSETEQFLKVASDASAYYNISMEEASEKVRGFAKGNFENGDAIGVFTSEASRNAVAMEQYGLKYSECTEAQKQMMALDIISHTQELSGVTGQASREAESWGVVTGNLKEGWRQFLAIVGAPLLQALIPVVQNLGGVLTDAGTKVQEFGAWLVVVRDSIANSTAFQSLSEIFGIIKDKFVELKNAFVDTGAIGTFKDQIMAFKDEVLAIDFMKLVTDIGAFIDKFAPLIAGVAGAYGAFQLYNLYLAIKSGIETVAIISMYAMETATLAMSGALAFITSPIGIAIIAIGALIAIGVLVYKNFDTIKAVAISAWGAIKDWISNAIKATGEVISSVMASISSTMSSIWNSIKSTTSAVWNSLTSTVSSVASGIASTVSSVFSGIGSTVSNIWNGIKSTVTNAIEGAKNAVSNAISTIKSVMNFSWSLPKLKMPHFSVTGSFGLNPPSVPKLGLEWFAKGGLMTKPTVFGMNGNNAMIGGEKDEEAILPLNARTLGGIGDGIASTMQMGGMVDRLDTLIGLFENMREMMNPNYQIVMDSGALVGEIKNDMNAEFSRASAMSRRGR